MQVDRPVDRYYTAPLPAEATETLPGTAARVEVYRQRAERGEQLWHPEDVGNELVTVILSTVENV